MSARQSNARQSPWFWVALGLIGVFGIITGGVLVLFYMSIQQTMQDIRREQQTATRPPPIHYFQESFSPLKEELCPGDKLTFPTTSEISVFGAVKAVRTWWSLDQQPTVVGGTAAVDTNGAVIPSLIEEYTLPPRATGGIRMRTRSYIVPQMSPGHYLFTNSLRKDGSNEAYFEVPFRVSANCGPSTATP